IGRDTPVCAGVTLPAWMHADTHIPRRPECTPVAYFVAGVATRMVRWRRNLTRPRKPAARMMKSTFWELLPRPIIGLAPMDGVGDHAFRHIQKKYGAPTLI